MRRFAGLQGLSLTTRLSVLFVCASTLVLLLLGHLILAAIDRHFVEQDMDLLVGKLNLTQHALAVTRSREDLASLSQRLDDSLVGHQHLAIAILDPAQRMVFVSEGMHFPASILAAAPNRTPQTWQNDHGYFRSISATIASGMSDGQAFTVIVGTEISHHEEFNTAFRRTLWGFVGFAALVMGLLGWFATRHALAPLRAMQTKAASITANNLDYRLPVEKLPAEFAELAHSLNQMLARLDESFARLSDFSSDLAHELRSPISNLLMQTQVGLSRPRSSDEYRELLYSNAEELERLTRMVADMLLLAKADNGLLPPALERIDLALELGELFDFYQALADDKSVALVSHGEAMMKGDRLMLRRAISNLLSNAIRHTASGQTVSVALADHPTAGRVSLSISNPGNDIAPEHLPRLFDRFYRVDASRHREGEGYGLGLGLAITKSIVQAHGGEVRVRSANGVTVFELFFPAI